MTKHSPESEALVKRLIEASERKSPDDYQTTCSHCHKTLYLNTEIFRRETPPPIAEVEFMRRFEPAVCALCLYDEKCGDCCVEAAISKPENLKKALDIIADLRLAAMSDDRHDSTWLAAGAALEMLGRVLDNSALEEEEPATTLLGINTSENM